MANNEDKKPNGRIWTDDDINDKNPIECLISAIRILGYSELIKAGITLIACIILTVADSLSAMFLCNLLILSFPPTIDCINALVKTPKEIVTKKFRLFHMFVSSVLFLFTISCSIYVIMIFIGVSQLPEVGIFKFKLFDISLKISVYFCVVGNILTFMCNAHKEVRRRKKIEEN